MTPLSTPLTLLPLRQRLLNKLRWTWRQPLLQHQRSHPPHNWSQVSMHHNPSHVQVALSGCVQFPSLIMSASHSCSPKTRYPLHQLTVRLHKQQAPSRLPGFKLLMGGAVQLAKHTMDLLVPSSMGERLGRLFATLRSAPQPTSTMSMQALRRTTAVPWDACGMMGQTCFTGTTTRG